MTVNSAAKPTDGWCCVAFKSRFEAAGDRDFAVIVDRSLESYAFMLQHRALEPGDPGPQNHPNPISIVSQMHIHFCPWCGTALAEFYSVRVSQMVRPGLAMQQP